MKTSGTPSPLELDALAETGNIGMGHAAAALSALMQKEVQLEVPNLRLLDPSAPAPPFGSAESVGLSMQISGGVSGFLLIILPLSYAFLILGREPDGPRCAASPFEGGELTALTAGGMRVGTAYLEAVGRLLRLPLAPSEPVCECAPASLIADAALARSLSSAPPLIIQTLFSAHGVPGSGRILLIPGAAGMEAILKALGTR